MSTKIFHRPLSFLLRALPIAIVPLFLLTPAQSKADTIFTGLAAFDAATTGDTTVSFGGLAPADSYTLESSGFTISGATFTYDSSTSLLFVIDPGYYEYAYAGGDFLNEDYADPDTLTIDLPAGTTAIGFNYGGLFGPTGSFGVTLSDGFATTLNTSDSIANGSLDFAGFTTSTDITSITLALPDGPNYNALDNIVFGADPAPTPEPPALGLVLTGVLGAAGAVRRRLQS